MNNAFLLIGGNMGNRTANLKAATEAIKIHCGTLIRQSPVYETAAWGLEKQPNFLNQALQVQTFLNAHALLHAILDIEKNMGRTRHQKYGPRLIDIDILLFDDAIIDTPDLKVPHPELHNRRFALQCLADIAPNAVHPLFQKPIHLLLDQCTDKLQVQKFS